MDENPVVGPVNPESTAPVEEKRSLWQVILSSRSKTFGILAIIVVIAAIPLTVIISQQQQETRQQAADCWPDGALCGGDASPCCGSCINLHCSGGSTATTTTKGVIETGPNTKTTTTTAPGTGGPPGTISPGEGHFACNTSNFTCYPVSNNIGYESLLDCLGSCSKLGTSTTTKPRESPISTTTTTTATKTHFACNSSKKCVLVSGGGVDLCTNDYSCTQTTTTISGSTHTICSNELCIAVAGAGTSQCANKSECPCLSGSRVWYQMVNGVCVRGDDRCLYSTCTPISTTTSTTSTTTTSTIPSSTTTTIAATTTTRAGTTTSTTGGGTTTTTGGGSTTTTQPPGNMILAFNVGLDGIGAAGDHKLPCTSLATCASNKNPRITARDLNITVLDQSKVDKTPNLKITVNYDSTTGTFKGNASANLTPGSYTIKVKSPGLLRKTLVSIQNLVVGTNQIPSANLTVGDINTQGDSNNALDILDYNVLISCSIYSNDNKVLCNSVADYKTLSDLNDNGAVDEIDYNLFLREYSVQNGD